MDEVPTLVFRHHTNFHETYKQDKNPIFKLIFDATRILNLYWAYLYFGNIIVRENSLIYSRSIKV